MGKKDPRVDQFIREAAPFARPILKRVRALAHRHCKGVEETIKWGMPFFLVDGKIICMIGAFKAHCNFGFWKGRSFVNPDGTSAKVGMGQLDRLTSVRDLPSAKLMASYFKQALEWNAKKKGSPRVRKIPKAVPRLPADFARGLRSNRKAWSVFTAFSPSKKREYIEWIAGAKSEETRERRMETAIEWIAQGKSRNWKYRS